jgi:hypothetical protein
LVLGGAGSTGRGEVRQRVWICVVGLTASLVFASFRAWRGKSWRRRILLARIAGAGVQVPANGAVTRLDAGASAPSIQLGDCGSDQDVCSNAKLTLSCARGVQS